MSRITAEQACAEYARWATVVRDLSAKIRKLDCQRTADYIFEKEKNQWRGHERYPDECLREFFANSADGEDDKDFMCPPCREKLATVCERKKARQWLGKAKRVVFMVGKRLPTLTRSA